MSLSTDTFSHILTLAQTSDQVLSGAAPSPGGAITSTTVPPGAASQSSGPGLGMFVLILPLLAVMILTSVMSGRKEKKKREQLLSSIKKNDKVVTLGGMIGTVSEIRDDEIVLKVDENANTKIRFTRAAIQQILTPAGDAGTPAAVEVKTKSPDRVTA